MIAVLTLTTALAADCTVVSGATVHTPSGPEKGTTVVVVDARIAAVGKAPRGLSLQLDSTQQVSGARYQDAPCDFVQASDGHLTAGLIVGPNTLGLSEVSLESRTRHADPQTDDGIRAALVAVEAYDPLSSVLGVTRVEGVTGSIVAPTGGWISGQAGYVQLDGATQAEAVIAPSVAMVAELPSPSAAEGLRSWRELAADVAAYRRNPAVYDTRQLHLQGLSRLDLEALGPVFDGRVPVIIGADGAERIEALIKLKSELNVQVVIHGAAEGWLLADALAMAEIPVLVDPTVYGAGSFDQLHGRPDNAALLSEAGVSVMFQNGRYNMHNARTVRQWAGNAVRDGLDHATALRGLTEVPAEVFGLPDRGRVQPGAVADLVLWTGDPLELSSWPQQVWIAGTPIDNRSRQTELRDRYRELPGTPAPLSLPR